MTQLSVNVNKIALLRNSRAGDTPSVVAAARTALDAGAAGVTVHPRPDQRHIRSSDVDDLGVVVSEPRYAQRGAEFNIEGNPFQGDYMDIVRGARPTQCTLVPDDPGQATSDHGWDIPASIDRLKPIIAELRGLGCRVSLFMDPDPAMIEHAADTGADRIELYTEAYAASFARTNGTGDLFVQLFDLYAAATARAQQAGLGVNAGHDLNLANLGRFATIQGILEVSIGHALVADALNIGLAAAVKAYLHALPGGLIK